MYTGFTFEELLSRKGEELVITRHVLNNVDILVDGRFIIAQKSIRLQFRGSSNQRVIDVKKTFAEGHIVQWEDLIK
jgi:anaerobic ribonucleoside-triphosphate reductase activating protein